MICIGTEGRVLCFTNVHGSTPFGILFLELPACILLAGQDEGERSDEERYPGPPGWGVEALDQHSNARKNVF